MHALEKVNACIRNLMHALKKNLMHALNF